MFRFGTVVQISKAILLTDIGDIFYVSVKFEMLVTDLGCKLPISNLTVEHPKNPYYDFP